MSYAIPEFENTLMPKFKDKKGAYVCFYLKGRVAGRGILEEVNELGGTLKVIDGLVEETIIFTWDYVLAMYAPQ